MPEMCRHQGKDFENGQSQQVSETDNVAENARKKLLDKGADLIVANDVSQEDAGFDVDTNRIALVTQTGVTELPLLNKRDAADRILDAAIKIRPQLATSLAGQI